MKQENDAERFVYVGVWEGLRVAVIVDSDDHKKDTAKEIARWVRYGYAINRELLSDFHKNGMASRAEIDAKEQEIKDRKKQTRLAFKAVAK